MKRRPRSERGMAGFEVLAFAVLLFYGGSLMVLNVWAVIDAKMAVVAASREGARAAVEAEAGESVKALAEQAVARSIAEQGRNPDRTTVTVTGALMAQRCGRVAVSVRYGVRLVALPGLRTLGSMSVRSTHSEVVDPYRSGLPGEGRCA